MCSHVRIVISLVSVAGAIAFGMANPRVPDSFVLAEYEALQTNIADQ